MNIKDTPPVKESKAKKNIVESDQSELLNFALPDVTQVSQDFIKDEADETGEHEKPVEMNEIDEAEKHRGTLDNKGNPYDPAIHAFPPEMTGKLRKWKKKPKAKVEQDIASGQKVNTAFRSEADKLATIYAQLHMLPFGVDGGIADKAELVPLVDDLERYLMETGHTNINPKWSVAISSLLYSVGVCQRPNNAEKLKMWFGGIWSKVTGFFKRKPAPVMRKRDLDSYRPQAETSKAETSKPKSENGSYVQPGGGF